LVLFDCLIVEIQDLAEPYKNLSEKHAIYFKEKQSLQTLGIIIGRFAIRDDDSFIGLIFKQA
jgi:hypothetical protein